MTPQSTDNPEREPAADGSGPPDPVAQLTRITQTLSNSLMTAIQAVEQLGARIRTLEDQQRTTQLCAAKALLAIGTMAQDITDEDRKMSVFKTLEEALREIRRTGAAPAKPDAS